MNLREPAVPGDPTLPGESLPGARGRHTVPAADAAATSSLRRLRRAALAPLGDDPTRRPPVVDGYEVGRLLGAGGSSVVWSGRGPDGVERALKVLQPDADQTAERSPDVLRELTLLRRVRHPRVVAVHDISTDVSTDPAGRPVLVLDLAAGGSLAAVLTRRRRLGAAEVSGLLSVLGPALEELHAAGIVHGDVSPGNVLLDARGEPLLADLGLSRALGHRHGSVLGTPGFADPAAVAGEGVDAASDVYGLAAVAWCALTGSPPVAAGALSSRLAVRRAGADLPAGTSLDLLQVLREGLHRKASHRPTPGELAQAAAACVRPRPVRAALERVERTAARVPAGVGAVTGAPGPARTAVPLGGAVGSVTRHLGTAPVPETVRARPAAATGRGAVGAGARRWPSRWVLVGTATAVVLAGAAAAVVLGQRDSPAALPAAAVQPAAPVAEPVAPALEPVAPALEPAATGAAGADVLHGEDWAAVVDELATRRADALTGGGTTALAGLDVAGSAAMTADVAVLEQLAASGSSYQGLGFEVVAVEAEYQDPARVVVRAEVTTLAHEVLGPDGTSTPVAATQPRASRLTLARVDGQWRISDVS